jgi:signal transduction histidine kinase
LAGALDQTGVWLILAAAVWTLLLTIVSLVDRRLPYHEIVTLVVNALLAVLFASLVAYQGVGFLLAGILTFLTASLYHRFQGGTIMAVGVILVFGILLTSQLGNADALTALFTPALVLSLTGMVAGMISQQVSYFVRNQQEFERTRLENEQRRERDRVQALYQVTSTLTATLNFQKVLDRSLDTAAAVLIEPEMDNVLISSFLLFDEDELYVGSARRFTHSDLRMTIPAKQGLIFQSLRSGQPRVKIAPQNDPELIKFISLRECGAVYCYPLRTNQEMYGALLFGHPDGEFFTEKRTEILEIIGRQSVVALQNANLYRDLEQEKERIMDIQEDARKQLARDLHDGPTQSVAAIAMRVNFARRLIDRDAQAASDELYKIEDLARRATKEIRHMLFTLRPLALETGGLIAALNSMAEKTLDTYSQKVVIETEQAAIDDLELNKQGVVFYIAEEAVNNARKYAGAEVIHVRLKKANHDVVLLEIVDAGVGFNVGEVDAGYEKRGSLGMVNMRERTELLNGVFQLKSQIGSGTQIRVWIPLSDDAGERLKRGRIE